MEVEKKNKLYSMLEYMSKYSTKQPEEIDELCHSCDMSPSYAPIIDLLVEAFLTVHSFIILMFEGLISNASAILRILIEQVAALTVIANDQRASSEFLRFRTWKSQYYTTTGEEHEKLRNYLIERSGYKKANESAIKDYLDYGWVRKIKNVKNERGDRLIIKEAHLDEMITDINETLNSFAHGQTSMFTFLSNKDLTEKHVSRIIMVAAKLFLFLCYAKHKLLVNDHMTSDKYFDSYLNAKIIYFDLNSKATNDRIVDIVKTSKDLNKETLYCMSTLDHNRGLIYQSELNPVQVNTVAYAYYLELVNTLFMLLCKIYLPKNKELLNDVKSLNDLFTKIGLDNIKNLFDRCQHTMPFERFLKAVNKINSGWGIMTNTGKIDEMGEVFITDFTSFVHFIFKKLFSDVTEDVLLRYFIPIN